MWLSYSRQSNLTFAAFHPMKKFRPRGLRMPGGVTWNKTQTPVLFVSRSFTFLIIPEARDAFVAY